MKKTLLFVAFMVANFCLAQTYMNGGLSTGATSKSGAAAPTGYTWSELQNNTGNTTETNTSLGLGGMYISTTSSFFWQMILQFLQEINGKSLRLISLPIRQVIRAPLLLLILQELIFIVPILL
jgi:hypothetical protein